MRLGTLMTDSESTPTSRRETRNSRPSTQTALLLVVPCVIVVLNVFVWITAVSRSGFWADDFLNVTHFAHSLGDLSDDHINTGKYIINIFWAIGTEAFGNGSVVPFLLLNSLVFSMGLVIWLRSGIKTNWSFVDAWWIGGLFVATAAWLPTALWSSNITHSGGFLALGVGAWAHNRSMDARTARSTTYWSVTTGVAWTFAIVSNILYVGLIVFAAYCAWHQIDKLRRLGTETSIAVVTVVFWNLVLPVVFFLTVAYPGTTSHAGYTVTGLQFVHENLRFYRLALAPTFLLMVIYLGLLVCAVIGAIVSVRRRDFFPAAVLGAAGATMLPALVQSQQRDIHYVAVPLLLLFSAFASGMSPVISDVSRRWKYTIFIAGLIAILFIFEQGANIRSYFVQSPYGSSLVTFRSEVASLAPEGAVICARLDLDVPHQTALIGGMSGEAGFLVPPISAARVYLIPPDNTCPATASVTHITVNLNARGNFVASR